MPKKYNRVYLQHLSWLEIWSNGRAQTIWSIYLQASEKSKH